jgi:hypothetical protein
MSGGVELARIDFWNSSTKAYYGHVTFTANDTNPTTKIDAYCELGGVTARTTQTVNYTPGATNTFVSHVGGNTSSAITKLPTEDDTGSIEITINCTAFYLDDVMLAIKQFVRNPVAGNYVFSADDGTGEVDANVEIISAGKGPGAALFSNGMWAFKNGPVNEIPNYSGADHWLSFGSGWTPIKGDFNDDGFGDIGLYQDGQWALKYGPVNLIPDFQAADKWVFFGGEVGWTPLVGDFDDDGVDDIALFNAGQLALKYGPVKDILNWKAADKWVAFGAAGWTPVVGDFNNNGTDDIGEYSNGQWALKYGPVKDIGFWPAADKWVLFGSGGWTPVVGDVNNNGVDDIALFQNGQWALKYGPVNLIPDWKAADRWVLFGAGGYVPLVGDFGNS